MGRAWRWWIWMVVGVCLIVEGRGHGQYPYRDATEKEDPQRWTWMDQDARMLRKRKELDEILRQHRLWRHSGHNFGQRADLSNGYLMGANLTGVDLGWVDLSRTDLKYTDLTWSDLVHADLTGADLIEADLSHAHLEETDLTGAELRRAILFGANLEDADMTGKADFVGADLTRAHLRNADLSDADLTGAHLRWADLSGAQLDGASLEGADLYGANYEPRAQPTVEGIAYAAGLDRLRYQSNPEPLHSLRKAFQDAGFERQGRQITASLQRSRLENSWTCIQAEGTCDTTSLGYKLRYTLPNSLNWALFDWTCAWGADWSHPLVLLGWLCLVCGPVYWVGMHFGRVGGIYQIVLDTTVVTKASKELVTRVETGVRWGGRPALRTRTFGQRERRVPTQIPYGNDKKEGQEPKQKAEADSRSRRKRMRRPGLGWGRVGPVLRAEWRALRLAFLFSVLSALDIGFHEFNVGVWARMLLARDFNLKARGWMRVAGGVQSLVGLGLVALSLLSYFGHPFD